jgi:hypothetical protein
MQLADAQRRFIEARAARRHIGLWVFPVFLAGLISAWALFFIYFPLAVNPWTVIGHIEARDFEPGTLTMYAITCTVLVNVLFAVLSGVLVLLIAWASHERRYLKLLEAAAKPLAPPAPAPSGETANAPRQ